jgi:excisionase family DNA binding protein
MNVGLSLPPEVVEAIAERAAELVLARLADQRETESESPYMTIPEAAEHLRCKRQRVDDLLSAGKLTRHKDGSRTLVERAELERYLNGVRR